MSHSRWLVLPLAALALGACSDFSAPADGGAESALALNVTTAGPDAPPAQVAALVEQANSTLASIGSELRIDEVWLYTVGVGTDPYRRLRTGSRWAWNPVTYLIDGGDLTPQLDPAVTAATIASSFQTWNDVENTGIQTAHVADPGKNIDVLDGRINDANGKCVSNIDLTAENLDLATGSIQPAADIVVGGWLPGSWFKDCLGSQQIIGVTFSISSGDANSDQYVDRLYVEQYYNEAFQWVTSGATFLGRPVDLESILVHENGHALGLGHFGAISTHQLTLKPNGKVYAPEAVMNPGYLGGEGRALFPTDVAALRTMYAQFR